MTAEFNGIERRLDELNERLARLTPLKDKPRNEFDQDRYLQNLGELERFADLVRKWFAERK